MASIFTWYTKRLDKEIKDETVLRLRTAARLVQKAAKAKVRVDTGGLKKSIRYRINKKHLVARVGTNKVYGIFQELGPVVGGTSYQRSERRKAANKQWAFTPYLRPAFHENEAAIKAILGVTEDVLVGTKMKLTPSEMLID
jgi:hypothetical protein